MKAVKFLVAVMGISLLFASCKSNMDLTKRHYTKGYYFHKRSSVEQVETKEAVAVKKEKSTVNEIPVKQIKLAKNENNGPELKGGIKENNLSLGFSKVKSNKQTASENTTVFKEVANKKASSSIQQKNKAKQQAKGGGSDANLILLVILCLFPILSLIAVYLHDGKSITMNFWLTLILHLTIIGYIIFSLLVVLDVVDLA